MAIPRYTRIDGKNSSTNWSSAAIIGFVCLCLVAGWLVVSSSVSPLQNARISFQQFVGSRENGNVPSKESESSIAIGQEDKFTTDNYTDSTMVVSNEEINDGKSAKLNPDKGAQFVGSRENGNVPPKESERSTAIGQEDKFTTDNSTDSTMVVSNEEINDRKSDKFNPDKGAQFVGSRENGNVPPKESASSTAMGQEHKFTTDNSTDSTMVVSNEEINDGKSDKLNPDKGAQFVGSPENGNVPPKESESSTAIGQEDKFTTDNSTNTKMVVSNEEINNGTSDKLNPDKGAQDENNKDFTYETVDGPRVLVPVGSPVEGKKDEVKNDSMKFDGQNQTDDLENALKGNAETQNETSIQPDDWLTQSAESEKEKASLDVPLSMKHSSYSWKLCNTSGAADYIPCLDNIKALKKLRSTKHYEHRERHCPDEPPACVVPIPERYRSPVKWPKSRDKIWFSNVPHTQLANYKGDQNWTKVSGQFIIFPGGGTQFTHGAPHYIDLIQEAIPEIAWGKRTRVIFDVGCGVASFGGYLFDNHVLTMSMAPKDEHEAQVQFALERGIPAISGVMGTKRLLFPSKVFDVVHCARCRVPWHIEGGKLLLELNRILRPGGYFVWSATPVYRNDDVDIGIWRAMYRLTKSICWELVTVSKDKLNRKATALFRKTTSNDCYQSRPENNPPLCEESDDPDEAWNVTLKACLHKLSEDASERGSQWPELWPLRLEKPPYWLKDSDIGVYGKPARKDFMEDYEHWKQFVSDSYLNHVEIDWPSVRNVMDMRAVYGGFAAALKDLQVWVMNVVPVDSTNTLPLIYERGLFGIYHNWCESFDTYPRTYDLLHANLLFSDLRTRCQNFVAVMAEVDRILRPGGKLMVIDDAETLDVVKDIAKSLNWMILFTNSRNNDKVLCLKKSLWRPKVYETLDSSTA